MSVKTILQPVVQEFTYEALESTDNESKRKASKIDLNHLALKLNNPRNNIA